MLRYNNVINDEHSIDKKCIFSLYKYTYRVTGTLNIPTLSYNNLRCSIGTHKNLQFKFKYHVKITNFRA